MVNNTTSPWPFSHSDKFSNMTFLDREEDDFDSSRVVTSNSGSLANASQRWKGDFDHPGEVFFDTFTVTSSWWLQSDIPLAAGQWNPGDGSEGYLFAYWRSKEEYLLLGLIVVAMIVVSLLGNAVVCLVTAPKLWTGDAIPLNVLVFSLAVSDVLKVVFDLLPKAVEYFCLQWPLGTTVCKMVSMLRCVFTDFSMGTMALIALESHETTALYTSITRFTNFFLPLAASWIGYMGVVHKTIKSRAMVSHGISGPQKSRRQYVSQKVTITCFCLTSLVTVSLTPFQLTLLMLEYGGTEQRFQAARCLKYVWLLTLLQSSANPFLYGFMWKNFRTSVKRLLRPCRSMNSVAPLLEQKPKGANSNKVPCPPGKTARKKADDMDVISFHSHRDDSIAIKQNIAKSASGTDAYTSEGRNTNHFVMPAVEAAETLVAGSPSVTCYNKRLYL